jgi:phytoene dehydrogenase-like protein
MPSRILEYFAILLQTLGVADLVEFVELDPDVFDRYVFPDYEFRLCKGEDLFRERLLRDFPKESRSIEKYFNVFHEIQEGLTQIRFTDRRLQTVLNGHSATYSMPPARPSVLIPLLVLGHLLHGAYYPKGGSGAFRDAFLYALRSNHADLRNRSRVVQVDRRGDEFLVITDTGEEYTARVMLSHVDRSFLRLRGHRS